MASKTVQRGTRLFNQTLKRSQKLNAIKHDRYPETSYLFETASVMLADRAADIKRNFNQILEIGSSGTMGRMHGCTKEVLKPKYTISMF